MTLCGGDTGTDRVMVSVLDRPVALTAAVIDRTYVVAAVRVNGASVMKDDEAVTDVGSTFAPVWPSARVM